MNWDKVLQKLKEDKSLIAEHWRSERTIWVVSKTDDGRYKLCVDPRGKDEWTVIGVFDEGEIIGEMKKYWHYWQSTDSSDENDFSEYKPIMRAF